MKILLIDTCGETGSIALADLLPEPTVLATATLSGRTASERLLPTIRDLAAPLETLDAVVVVHGPGSFTGVRVGLSAAKGLCEALHLPLIAISRLAVLAHPAGLSATATRIQAVLDAGRGEFYSGVYVDGVCLREALLTHGELLAAAQTQPQDTVVCEPAVAASLAILAPRLVDPPTAASALPLAVRRIQDEAFDDIATLDANYLRRTDAEIFAKPRPTKNLHPTGASVS